VEAGSKYTSFAARRTGAGEEAVGCLSVEVAFEHVTQTVIQGDMLFLNKIRSLRRGMD
jgi:hypothetical protein